MEGVVYPRGSIRRIRLTDFMSFVGTVSLEAGSRVNVVEGPNGSGKSSLVTALCVGLAGHMKALGRQTKPVELIRRGCSAFEVEITLSGGPDEPDIVVHRRTELAGAAAGWGGGRSAHTTWQIDGREVSEARVKELSRDMGIHFDNLCQFLPQERVAEFSNLGPTELLESTEEAIGGGHLLQQHGELKRRSELLRTKREELQRTREQLERVEAAQQASQPDYRRLQRRNALRRQVERLRQKLLWVERERCQQQLAQARAAAAAVRGRVGEARQRLTAAQAPINAHNREMAAAKQVATGLAAEARALEERVTQGLARLRQRERQLNTLEEELQGLRDRSARWHADLARAREERTRLRGERAALPLGLSPGQVARLQALDLEIQQAAGEVGFLEFQLGQKRQDVAALEAQIRALQAAEQRRHDLREQRLRRLERTLPLSRPLYEWITETRAAGRFRRRVLGPLLMEISPLHNPVWAAQLEFIVGKANLGAVVCEDMEDNDMVQRFLGDLKQRHRGGGRVNKLLYLRDAAAPSAPYPNGTAAQYASYGITHTVDQLFEASSELVKEALRETSGIHTAFVGTEYAAQPAVLEQLTSRTLVRRVLTPSMVAIVSASEYDATHVSTKILDLPPAVLMNESAGAGEGEQQQQQLEARQQEKSAAEDEARQLAEAVLRRQAATGALQAQKTQLQEERRRLERSAAELYRRETDLVRRLTRLEGEDEPLATAGALRAQLCSDAEALLQLANDNARLIAQQHQLLRRQAVSELSLAAAASRLMPLQQAVREAEEGLAAAQRDAERVARQEERAAEAVREAEAALREELGAGGPDAALREAWAEVPDEAREVEALLAAKQAEMEAAQADLRGDEAAVVEAWKRREADIARLRQEAAAGASEVQAAEADVEARKSAWLPELQRHMAAIDGAVRKHFASIGCAGEVALREAGDAFGEYAAEIRVQYRNDEPLRPLSRSHHSGGERSVATMLYLMALQGVTTTPFRVVDEINQGMDSNNERRVFNLLVECSSRPDTPQCFLLTPKLIARLRFNDHIRAQSLKCPPGANILMTAPVAAQLAEDAEQHKSRAGRGGGGGGGGGAAAAPGRPPPPQQQQRPLAAPMLAQLPWHEMKNILLLGRTAAIDEV